MFEADAYEALGDEGRAEELNEAIDGLAVEFSSTVNEAVENAEFNLMASYRNLVKKYGVAAVTHALKSADGEFLDVGEFQFEFGGLLTNGTVGEAIAFLKPELGALNQIEVGN